MDYVEAIEAAEEEGLSIHELLAGSETYQELLGDSGEADEDDVRTWQVMVRILKALGGHYRLFGLFGPNEVPENMGYFRMYDFEGEPGVIFTDTQELLDVIDFNY